MTPLETLMEEHQLILRTIASLKNFAGKVQNGDDLPLSDLAGFTRFICQFADRSHHGKEEDILSGCFACSLRHNPFSQLLSSLSLSLSLAFCAFCLL